VETISPELALVDDTIGRAALETASHATESSSQSCVEGRTLLPCPSPSELARRNALQSAELTPQSRSARGRRQLGAALAVCVAAVPFMLVGDRVVLGDGPYANRATQASPPILQTSSQADVGDTSSDIMLRWKPAGDAALYNVILWRDGARALDLWPTKAAVQLPSGELAPGEYLWFVYPGRRTPRGLRYGSVVAHGRFSV